VLAQNRALAGVPANVGRGVADVHQLGPEAEELRYFSCADLVTVLPAAVVLGDHFFAQVPENGLGLLEKNLKHAGEDRARNLSQ